MPKMKELIEVGLFGLGLIKISDPILIARYNACLVDMGLEPTKLKSFSIDRIGWSPEIAAEKGDDYYLSHGEANPFVIILTPLQESAPIYFPMHSFDWRLMHEWYVVHCAQVVVLTEVTAIWLDIDQEVDLYAMPSDLLMVDEVIVRAHTPCGIMNRFFKQKDLVRKFLADPIAHVNMGVIDELCQSRQEDGDLRGKKLLIRDAQFSNLSDFYSRVFGGTFILRSKSDKPLIIMRDVDKSHGNEVFPAEISTLDTLIEFGYVESDLGWWKNNLHRLMIVAESFLIDVLDEEEPELDYVSLNDAKKKQIVNKYKDKLTIYLEVVRVIDQLEKGDLPKVSADTCPYLLHPHGSLSQSSEEVVWQLLTYIRGGRMVPLYYRHQKTAFIEAYTTKWNTPRRTWAVARIKEHYTMASKSK